MQTTAEERAALRLRQAHGDNAWDVARVEHALAALERRVRRRRVARVSAVGLVAAACVVVALAGRGHLGDRREAHELVTATPAPSPPAMRVGDGSMIWPAEGARVTVREVSNDRVVVALEAGRASFEVAHRPERQFAVETAEVQVIVVGTRFSVEQLADTTYVQVSEGHVRIAWRDDRGEVRRDLFAGGEGTFPDRPRADTALAPTAPSTLTSPSSQRKAARPARNTAADGGWRRLARGGGYRAAYDLIVAGGAGAVGDDVGDLLLAADAARLSGHPARALPYLDRAIQRGDHDERAPMAAFTRGRVQMGLGRPLEAATSFDRAIALGAQGSLQENALARAIEAYRKAGDPARASQLARQYVDRYPDGRWLGAVRGGGTLPDSDEKLPR